MTVKMVTNKAYENQDRAAENAARSAELKKSETKDRQQKRLAGAIISLLPARDLEVLEWLCKSLGKPPGLIALEMVRRSIILERRGFQEANGGGGATSQSIELLADRLQRK